VRNGDRRSTERNHQDVIDAFDRERNLVRELNRRHEQSVRNSHAGDRQVLIERRRHPR
jgi:hypothetical protein